MSLSTTLTAIASRDPATCQPPALRDLMTTGEVADWLRVAEKSVILDRCRRRWKIPFRKIGRRVVYVRAEVAAWFAEHNNMAMEGA
jgi:hypothetical protein